MVIPVIKELRRFSDIEPIVLALTLAGPVMEKAKLPYLGFKDFVRRGDEKAVRWGCQMTAATHRPDTHISIEESVAYHGLSYSDLVIRLGEPEGAQRWQEHGRQSFLPLTVMERIIKDIAPDMVVTTNSPRAERAAVEVAKHLGIPTLSMVDLFGINHQFNINADFISVISEITINNMIQEGVSRPRDAFLVLGNPAFDEAFHNRGPVDYVMRDALFPGFPKQSKLLLWVGTPAEWRGTPPKLHLRTDEEIVENFETLSKAAALRGAYLGIRPHPSKIRPFLTTGLRQHITDTCSMPKGMI